MNRRDFIQMVSDLNEERLQLCASKSFDYATEDALSNFKRVTQVCRVWDIDVRRSPADCADFLTVLKLDRKFNLRDKPPQNESVKDTILDLHNYVDLSYACDSEIREVLDKQ